MIVTIQSGKWITDYRLHITELIILKAAFVLLVITIMAISS